MKILKVSYIIHTIFWIVMIILSLFSKLIAQIPIFFLLGLSFLHYDFLSWIINADDPYATRQGGIGISANAWKIYTILWIVFLIGLLIFIVLKWRQGKRLPLMIAGHVPTFIIGFVLTTLVGSIYFPFFSIVRLILPEWVRHMLIHHRRHSPTAALSRTAAVEHDFLNVSYLNAELNVQ